MRVQLESGRIYFYQTKQDISIFLCLNKVVLKPSNTFFSAFVFIQQSDNENIDGWNGLHEIAMNSDQANNLYGIEDSFDWLASNDFTTGTPQQQIITSCFDAIY